MRRIFCPFFKEEQPGGKDHGEAPFPAVLALCITAALTFLLFLFPDIPLALAQQIGVEVR
jgi:multicomponent Na+:H+ antiporter subunit D